MDKGKTQNGHLHRNFRETTMSRMVPRTELDFKIIRCLSEIYIQLGIPYFYLPNLATIPWGSGPPRSGLEKLPCLPPRGL